MIDNLANRLRNLRKERGLSQQELAFELGVSRSAVAGWERSQKQPSIDMLRRLALFFNVSSDYMYGRTIERRNIVVSPVSEMRLDKLNADGLRMLSEFYRLLAGDSRYMA